MFKRFFFGKSYDNVTITNEDAVRIAIQSIILGLFMAYMLGPTEYGLWGLMVKAANFFGTM